MNPKNTITLAMTLGLLTVGLYVVRSRSTEKDSTPPPKPTGAVTSRKVIEDSPGEVIKISLTRPGHEDWLFEKKAGPDGGPVAWRMTAPSDFKALSWEVEKLPRQLGSLMYDISYEPGESGAVSADAAGLDPPRAVISMNDKDGNEAVVEIGGPAGKQETYVRLAGSSRICVGKSSLSGLFKDKAVEYREKMLWAFNETNATRLEIVDRSDGEKTYLFTRDGSHWMIESPVAARATAKVQEAIKALSHLRVIQWVDDDERKLPIYGLATPALTLTATVERTITIPPDNPELGDADAAEDKPEAPPKTETKTSVYVLQVADRSPIGEDTKVYVRTGIAPAVATVMKTTIDKLRPVMKEWRDRKLTTVDVTGATGFELTTRHGSVKAERKNDAWQRADGSGSLDGGAIAELLKSIQELSAAAYVQGEDSAAEQFGFASPQATITLTVPGAAAPERIVIGAFTNPTSKRLVYARRNDELAIAKVRSADVAQLLQDPIAYADHNVFDLPPTTITGLAVESDNTLTAERQTLRYARDGETWAMTAPIVMAVDQDALGKLVAAIATLRATNVVGASDVASAFGLHQPAIVVTITYDLTPGTGDKGEDTTATLLLSEHDGKFYAKRKDAATIYELDGNLFGLLTKENNVKTVWSFDPDSVLSFSVQGPDGSFTFNQSDGHWTYAAEPDLPLSDEAVQKLLLRIRDLRVTRVADYSTDNLSMFSLDQPKFVLMITHTDGTSSKLAVGSPAQFEGKLFAKKPAAGIVLMLEENAADRFKVMIDTLEKNGP